MSELHKSLKPEAMERLIVSELHWQLINMRTDYEKRLTNPDAMAVFRRDRHDDLSELQRHIDAFVTVLRYYGDKDP